jgi:hypothetical protein
MVQGLTGGQPLGWGQLYFFNEYTQATAAERASHTGAAVLAGTIDQVASDAE